jgi:hypothetical protein
MQNKATLDRILTDVFEDDKDDGTAGDIRKALENDGSPGITDLATMDSQTISGLFFVDKDGKDIALKRYQVGIIKTFKGYLYHRANIGKPLLDIDDWDTLDHEAYNSFRVSTSWMILSETGLDGAPMINPPTNMSNGNGGPSSGMTGGRIRDPVMEFKKGIKRDVQAYPDLKQDKGWDGWNRGTISQARAQDVSEVLNDKYNPTDPIDIALFSEKQKFMYAVFKKHLLSDKGKALVRTYHQTADAQAVYRDLRDYALSSTKASMGSRDLLTYITSSRLGDGTWKGGTHAYILNWQDQLRKYQDLIPVKDHFSADLKRAMLENAVSQVPELRAIKTQADHAKTQSGKHLTYLQYCSLLASAAQQYDDQFAQSSVKTKNRRSVYQHELEEYEQPFDIDLDVLDLVEVNKANFLQGPRLQKQQWDRLTEHEQTAWDTFTNEGKKIVLEQRKPSERPPRPPTGANFHEISAYDYLEAYNHGLSARTDNSKTASDITGDAPSHKADPDPHDEDNTLLAHMTKRVRLPPGDIQRVLSSTMSKGSKTEGDELTINGKKYRSVNMTRTVYRTAAHRSVRRGALVDRGQMAASPGMTSALSTAHIGRSMYRGSTTTR